LIEELNVMYNENKPQMEREAPRNCPYTLYQADGSLAGSIFSGLQVESCMISRGEFRAGKATVAIAKQFSPKCIVMRENHYCGPACPNACDKMTEGRKTKQLFLEGKSTCGCGGQYGTNNANAVREATSVLVLALAVIMTAISASS
jgi:hypothetical protein